VGVGVDEAGADDAASSVDASGVAGDVVIKGSFTECGDGIAFDQHRRIVQDGQTLGGVVEGDDGGTLIQDGA
jgi:hypothetical protein